MMADISFVFRSIVLGAVVAVTMGQFGFPGMALGGNPAFAALGGGGGQFGGARFGGGNPLLAGRGGFAGGGLPFGGGFRAMLPPQPTTTTPAPTPRPLTPQEKETANTIAKLIYYNHKKKEEEERKRRENMTPQEKKNEKIKKIIQAFNASQ